MSLTDEEIALIEHEASLVPLRKSACIEALKIVQARRGWISDELLGAVAVRLGMSSAELDNVASFYNLIFRRPVGRHVVLMCDSVSCMLSGGELIERALVAQLGAGRGGTTKDGRFTLLPIACLGQCERAPAVMIDDDVHAPITPGGVRRALEGYR